MMVSWHQKISAARPQGSNLWKWLLPVLAGLASTWLLANPGHADAGHAEGRGKARSTTKASQVPVRQAVSRQPGVEVRTVANRKANAPDKELPGNPFPKRFPAPQFDGGKGWLNTSGPIDLKDLRGKVVLLDFWTYCCINCMHILPDLKYLEEKYDKQLVVIGVHSAKFENEKDSENIREAIMRYEISHPVINDSEMTVWQKFNVRSWPTLVLIDPEGNYCGFLAGEGNRKALDMVIDKVIDYHRAKGTLDESPVHFNLERHKAEPTPLRYPGKVLADEPGKRLFISDSNHNRIIITSLDGKLQETIGTGAIGRANGSYDNATFDHPQGMCLVDQTLYVADTENHLIREIDLAEKTVKTLAGTGMQANFGSHGGPLRTTALNSPWDLVMAHDKLYIAMAGPHQIWVLDLHSKSVRPYAGSGREDIKNGSLKQSAFAQPSGITTDGTTLYVVDSEGSAVRAIKMAKGDVTTLAGTSDLPNGKSLFEFGDKDGKGSEARLQHPLGIILHAGWLYVADSYNHKIKRLDPKTHEITTYLGDGETGNRNEPPRFSEPAGLTIAGNTMYVADTNNHQIRTIDLKTGKVSTLTIAGLNPPTPQPAEKVASTHKSVRVDSQKVLPGDSLTFEIQLELPAGYKLNKLAPLNCRLNSSADQKLVNATDLSRKHKPEATSDGQAVTVQIPLSAKTGKAELQLTLSYSYCRDGIGGLCKMNTASWSIPVELASDGAKSIQLKVEGE